LFLRDFSLFAANRPPPPAEKGTVPAPAGPTLIQVRGVSYAYPGTTTSAVEDVTLTFRAGETVALVGANGSGKTTLARVLCGLLDPMAGDVRWDGVDVATIDPAVRQGAIAPIFQDFLRFEFDGASNIGLGRVSSRHDRAGIESAGTRSGADEFLRRLPRGYDTRLSSEYEGGADLSTGQWQRVALARLLFRDARLIVLDEPAAALDARAEREMFEQFRQVAKERAVVLISHRLASVAHADRIVVLDGGRVVEEGTHAELLTLGGRYAELFRLQADGYLEPDR
jgi:ABC-type multidrug transport system fused ATPase/permease subunit